MIDPARTALVAMDFQGSILATLPDPDVVVRSVSDAIASVRAAGGCIAYVRVAFTAEDLLGFPSHSAMGQRMAALGEKVLTDSPLTQIDERIAPEANDIVVRKSRVGPFSTTDLAQQLRGAGIDTLLLAGIHTSGCVLTAVRDAHDLDFRVFVLSDGCADPDPAVHSFLTSTIFPKQATVISVAELSAAIAGNKGA